MGLFNRRRTEPVAAPRPTPFIAEVLRRTGEEYGGFDAIGPLPPGASDPALGPGMEVTIHIAGEPDPERPEFLPGTGIIRTARVIEGRTEVFDGETLIATFDDLTIDVFGERKPS